MISWIWSENSLKLPTFTRRVTGFNGKCFRFHETLYRPVDCENGALKREPRERELEAVEPYIIQGFTEPLATRYLIYPPRYTFSSEMATVSQCSLPFPLYFHRVAVVDLLSLSGYMPPLVIYPPPPWPTYHPTYILKLEFLNRKNHAGPSIFESSVLCVSLLTVCAYTYGWYYFLLQLH